MPRLLTLSVIANPFAALDHEGRPAGVVLLDPVEHHPYGEHTTDAVTGQPRYEPRRYVGAEIDAEATQVVRRAGAQGLGSSAQFDLQDTVWKFSAEPQTVPQTHYYLDRLRDGELFAADPATARLAGKPFVEPKEALAGARAHALGLWFRARPHHDVPEWATPADFADLHEDYSSDDHKAAHAEEHGERMKVIAEAEAVLVKELATQMLAAAAKPAGPALVALPPKAAPKASESTARNDEVK